MSVNKNLPNYITGLRILGTVALLFVDSLTLPFFIIYVLTGVTDALDGFIARKTNTASALGALLDSIADLIFYTVLLVKILPEMIRVLPWGIWYVVAGVVLVRLVAYDVAFLKYHRFASVHTYMNKLTGAAIFVYPFFLPLPAAVPVAFAVCAIAGLGSLEELLIHVLSKTYPAESVKTIFSLRRI